MSSNFKTELPKEIQELYPFTPKTMTTQSGYKLSYIDEGTGTPVVMVHGNPTWSFFYRDLIKKVSLSNRCIALDNMGCGLSDKPQDFEYTLENHIQNLEQLINEELKLEKVDLVVHDWGGAIGCGYATRHPDKVRKIVVMNTAAFTGLPCPTRIAVLRIPIFNKIAIRGFNLFAFPALYMTTERSLSCAEKTGYIYPYNSWKNRIAVYNFVQDIPLDKSHRSYNTLLDIEYNLNKLSSKEIFICWGDKDFCFTTAFADHWVKLFPNAKLKHHKNAGHYLMEDAPSICDDIFNFINS